MNVLGLADHGLKYLMIAATVAVLAGVAVTAADLEDQQRMACIRAGQSEACAEDGVRLARLRRQPDQPFAFRV